MTNDYLVKRVFKQFFVSSVIALLAATLGMTIDNILAGQLIGPDALGAMSLVMPLFMVIVLCSGILSNGAGTVVARYLGANKLKQVNCVFTLTIIFGLIISGVIILAVLPNAEAIAKMLGAQDAERISMSTDYIRGLMIGVIPISFTSILGAFIRVDGSPRLGMASIVVMGVTDIIFDIVFAGTLKMGMFGMALGTSLSYLIALVISLAHFGKKTNTLRFVRPQAAGKEMKAVVKNGLPNALQNACNAALSLTLNHLVIALGGAIALNALSVQNSVRTLLQPVAMGVGYALAPVAGIFFGEKDGRAIRDTVKLSFKLGLPLCLAVTAAAFLFADPIVSLFNTGGSEATKMAALAVRLFVISLPLSTINGVFMYSFQSIGKLWIANVINVGRSFGYNVLFAFAARGILGTNAVWLSVLGAELLTLLTLFIIVTILNKRPVRGISDMLLLPQGYLNSPDAYEISIADNMDEVLTLSRDINAFCLSQGASARKSYFAALCIEEMAGNVVKYGFGNEKGHFLDIKVVVNGDDVAFRLRDDGVMFDPMRYAEEQEGSGRIVDNASNIGIKLVRSIAKTADYRNSVRLNNLFITL